MLPHSVGEDRLVGWPRRPAHDAGLGPLGREGETGQPVGGFYLFGGGSFYLYGILQEKDS